MFVDRRQILIDSIQSIGIAQILPGHSASPRDFRPEGNAIRGTINPSSIGAAGDGTKDDWEPLQELLNIAAAKGGSAYIPSGIYRISRPLSINYSSNAAWISGFRIFGDGPGLFGNQNTSGTCLLPTYDQAEPAISIQGSPNTDDSHKGQINGLSIESIGIDGRYAKKCDGIQLKNIVNIVIANVHISRCSTGVVISRQANGESFGYAHGLLFEQLTITACREWGMRSIGRGSVSAVLINPNFTENSQGGISVVGCPLVIIGGGFFGNKGAALIHKQNDARSDSFGPVILGTRFESNGMPAHRDPDSAQIILEHYKNSSITSSWFLGSTVGQNGIRLPKVYDGDTSSRKLEVRNCRFDGMRSNSHQTALTTNRNMIPYGIETCTYNNILAPIRFYGEDSLSSLTENRAEAIAKSIRIGSVFYQELEGKLVKVDL
jgi:Pectate lyase superfamily protein